MKPLIGLTLCLAALLLPAASPAARAQSERAVAAGEVELPALIASLERQRANAIVRRDIPVLRNLMDRQYYHVEARGRVRSKTELLTTLERDEFRIRTYELESTEIQILDDGAALVTGILRMAQAGKPPRVTRVRFARIWVRQPDGWKNTFHQGTMIRSPQDSCQCD